MRRCYPRGWENILKRQLVHVGAFNLSLILRQEAAFEKYKPKESYLKRAPLNLGHQSRIRHAELAPAARLGFASEGPARPPSPSV